MAKPKRECEMCGGGGFIFDGVGSVMCPQCGGTGIEPGQDEDQDQDE